MSYTITAAQYADVDDTTALVTTIEVGLISISSVDNPSDWAALTAWSFVPGQDIAAFSPDFDKLREAKRVELKNYYMEGILGRGVSYGGDDYNLLPEFYNNILAIYTLGVSSSAGFYIWTSKQTYTFAGTVTTFSTNTNAIDFGNGIIPKFITLSAAYAEKDSEILAIGDNATDINSYDVQASWPSV